MDDASADLILTLQLQDLDNLQIRNPSETASHETLDAQLAFQLYTEQLRHAADTLTDLHHHQSIREAVATDSRPPSPLLSATPRFDQAYSELVTDSRGQSETARSPLQHADSEASTTGCEALHPPMIACVSCGDATAENHLMKAPCGDDYCTECINELFTLASKDESLFPPRCCQKEITLEQAGLFLEPAVYKGFEQRIEEFSTTSRVYCFKSDCGAFISPNDVDGDRAECKKCHETTCAVCQAAMHDGDCPLDPAVQSMMKVSADAGFRQCYNCKRMVELDIGCFHITCRCGAEFCYTCGAVWKTCRCPIFDEARLLVEAEELVDREAREPGGAVIDLEEAQANIRQFEQLMNPQAQAGWDVPPVVDLPHLPVEAQDLVDREAHEPAGAVVELEEAQANIRQFDQLMNPQAQAGWDVPPVVDVPRTRREILTMEAAARIRLQEVCQHSDWNPVGVRRQDLSNVDHQCNICHQALTRYLLECIQCRMRACVRCRRNRLR